MGGGSYSPQTRLQAQRQNTHVTAAVAGFAYSDDLSLGATGLIIIVVVVGCWFTERLPNQCSNADGNNA